MTGHREDAAVGLDPLTRAILHLGGLDSPHAGWVIFLVDETVTSCL